MNGKKVLVIGAASSIGQAVVEAFSGQGASVLATVHEHRPQSLNRNGVIVVEADLLNSASLSNFCGTTVASFGLVEVVVFLSGVLPGRSLVDYDDDLMHQVMTVNFTGQATLMRHLLPHLAEGALVLMVSSISGERGSFDPIYAAAKAAQIGFVRSLATWLAPKVRCNAISPALVEESTMFNSMSSQRRSKHLEQTPTQRLTTKDEIAGVILSLCDPAWSNVNGQVIRINGGALV